MIINRFTNRAFFLMLIFTHCLKSNNPFPAQVPNTSILAVTTLKYLHGL